MYSYLTVPIYLVILMYATAGLPFLVWGFLSHNGNMKWPSCLLALFGLLMYSLLTGHGALGTYGAGDAIYLAEVIAAVALFLGGRWINSSTLSLLFRLLPLLCVIELVYWDVAVFPFWVYYAHSILEPLTVAVWASMAVLALFAVVHFVAGRRSPRLPVILGAFGPLLITPFHPFYFVGYAVGGATGWLVARWHCFDGTIPLLRKLQGHSIMWALVGLGFAFAFLISATYGTFGLLTDEPNYQDSYVMDLAFAAGYSYLVSILIWPSAKGHSDFALVK
jgi:hypothetical protein